ncbi:MAG TPA: hypothetical protein VHN74_15810 [Candidatus Angelobacter sp.]|jgi:hypothetical protein|nr:hypothetical protein [Candidatus Angelobacter sp.]
MLKALKEFQVGRPQMLAGLMLLAFLAQALWVATSRRFSPLEYQYIEAGLPHQPGQDFRVSSPLTSWIAGLPFRLARMSGNATVTQALIIPRPWLVRLPFVAFGLWLGGAIWWVARRLFDDHGGYVALALFCTSSAMVMIASNIGPEVILAWSSFGLIYTAIGVAHTLYAPPKKWLPRIVLLGLSIGFSLAAAYWSIFMVALAVGFMLYLAPGRRKAVLLVVSCALAIGLGVYTFFTVTIGAPWFPVKSLLDPHFGLEQLRSLAFPFAEGYTPINSYLFVAFVIAALTAFGSWERARYFGNTAPLLTAYVAVLLFSLPTSLHFWYATLGFSFVFIFIGGVAADLLETSAGRAVAATLVAGIALRGVLNLAALARWSRISG